MEEIRINKLLMTIGGTQEGDKKKPIEGVVTMFRGKLLKNFWRISSGDTGRILPIARVKI